MTIDLTYEEFSVLRTIIMNLTKPVKDFGLVTEDDFADLREIKLKLGIKDFGSEPTMYA